MVPSQTQWITKPQQYKPNRICLSGKDIILESTKPFLKSSCELCISIIIKHVLYSGVNNQREFSWIG